MIEPAHFDHAFQKPVRFDARKEASFKKRRSVLLNRAKSRNPTLKQTQSLGVFAFCQGSTMSYSNQNNRFSHLPAQYGGHDL